MKRTLKWLVLPALLLASCERLDDKIENYPDAGEPAPEAGVSLDALAEIFSEVPFGTDQMKEVHDAVVASSGNGYDEEYTIRDLFAAPGTGVGDDKLETKSPLRSYDLPLRDLLARTVRDRAARTKAEGGDPEDPEAYLRALETSDAQIYWPYYENWDGEELPVITFDPGDNSSSNVGYRLVEDAGGRRIEKVTVNEDMAMNTPVWVINRNDDAAYTSIDVLRKNDPDWGLGGGLGTKSDDGEKTLFLKDFKMLRNYDCWFRGASEFFIKAGSVEDFKASTDAELRLYTPTINDFMLVVRRRMKGVVMPVNSVVVSQWTDQLEKIGFMMIEDDGGTMTSWKCSAVVKYNSKSYGFEVDLPLRRYDDIVWRGQLSRTYLTRYSGQRSRYGDVEITFSLE